KFGISFDTLRHWLRQRKISVKTSSSETRLYDIFSFLPELITQNDTSTTSVTEKKGFLYARVSSNKQKEVLEKQKQILKSRFPNYELVKLRVKGLHDKVFANIIDESIDEALIARKNIIQKNLKETKKSLLSFKFKKDLRQTMTDRKRDLCLFHFEKRRKHNKWPSQKIDCDCKLMYICKTNKWVFYWVYEAQKQIRKIQADVHVVSIDPGVRTLFTWYSSTKDRLASSISKRKKKKALHVDKAIFHMQQKIRQLQYEIHQKTIKFLTDEFNIIIIPPFKVSDMKRIHVIIQNEAYTLKTCSWCRNIQNIGRSETYKCKNCNIKIDRDVNGTQGIFLRALLDEAMILS
ncbi:15741_t:CDS:2, partial [Cetraspora pellucida]